MARANEYLFRITDYREGIAPSDLSDRTPWRALNGFTGYDENELTTFPSFANNATETEGITTYAIYKDGTIYALGRKTASDMIPQLYKSNNGTLNSSFTQVSGATATGGVLTRSFAYYPTYDRFIGVNAGGTVYEFYESGGTWNYATAPALFDTVSLLYFPKPYVHPDDDICYIAQANQIHRNDNGTYTASVLVLPTREEIAAITKYNQYLAIYTRNKADGLARVWFWNRFDSDISSAAVVGYGYPNELFVLGNNLFAVLTVPGFRQRVAIKQFVGGSQFETAIEVHAPETQSTLIGRTTYYTHNTAFVDGDYAYFWYGIEDIGVGIYSLGRRDGRWGLLNLIDFYQESSNYTANCYDIIEQERYFGFTQAQGGVGISYLATHDNADPRANESGYAITTYNPAIPKEHWGKRKVLQHLAIPVHFNEANDTITVYCRKDTETNWTQLKQLTATGREDTELHIDGVPGSFYRIQFKIVMNGAYSAIRFPITGSYRIVGETR